MKLRSKFKVEEDKELTMETEYIVPPHSSLGLDPLQCRVCLKKYAHEKTRKRHEQTHRIIEVRHTPDTRDYSDSKLV